MLGNKLAVYQGCTPVVDTVYESDGPESIVVIVAEALAKAQGVDSADLPPLYDSINVDALEAVVSDWGGWDSEMYLGFNVDGWNVFVSSDGRVRVCDASVPTKNPEPIFT